MAEAPQPAAEAKPSKFKNWLKGVVTAFAGLLAGSGMMYLSPLLDKVIKPAKPVANFAVEHQGLTVTLYNRSLGHGEGWWDFGDGSPLEPVSGKEDHVVHTYASPGTYTAKLTVRNLLGEESERSVTIQLENKQAVEPPQILALEAIPVGGNAYAPATFRLCARTKNAQLCVWNYGDDDRPLEFNDPAHCHDRLVTFPKPGGWVVKLAAVNGNQAVERSTVVYVEEPPREAITALLTVTEQATQVERVEVPHTVVENFTPDSKSVARPINKLIPARQGFEITAARWEPVSGKGGKDIKLAVAADRRSARLTGELVKDSGRPQNLILKVILTQEQRKPVTRPPVTVTAALSAPGTDLLPLPPPPQYWTDVQRQLRLELRDGDRIIWPQSQLPHNVPVTIRGRRCILNATVSGEQVRVDITEPRPGQTVAAN
jgi:hypothetical protein